MRCSRATRDPRRACAGSFSMSSSAISTSPATPRIDATVGLDRADELYQKIFFEYGDDSVAQLGGVHLACEQASNLLTKVLERGRLMSYLEQSTRYLGYDRRLGNGLYRFYRDNDLLESRFGARYIGEMDRMFDTYGELLPRADRLARPANYPKTAEDTDFVYRQAIRAKALDALRGLLPASALSNLGIYASGQAYEALLLRMRAHPSARSARVRPDDARRTREGHPVVPQAARRSRTRRRLDALPRDDRAARRASSCASCTPSDEVDRVGEDVRLVGFDPDGRGTRAGSDRLCQLDDVRTTRPHGASRAMSDTERASGLSQLRRRARQPPPPTGAGLRAHRLPLRDRQRLRSVSRPPAPPDAHHRVAAAHRRPGL